MWDVDLPPEEASLRVFEGFGSSLGSLRLTAYGGDADGGRVRIDWDLDGDGVFDDASGRHAVLPVREDEPQFRAAVQVHRQVMKVLPRFWVR